MTTPLWIPPPRPPSAACAAWRGVIALLVGACGSKAEKPADPVQPAETATVSPATSASVAASVATPAVVAGPFNQPAVIPTFEKKDSCDQPTCKLEIANPETPRGGSAGPPASMWEYEVSKGSKVIVPKRKDSTVVAILLAGTIEWEKDAKARLASLQQAFEVLDGAGFFGGAFSFRATADKTRLLFVSVEHPESMRGKKPAPFDTRAFAFSLRGGTNLAWGEGGYGARIALEQDPALERAVASVTFLGIGSPKGVAEHVHENEWEMLAILSGSGRMTLGKGDSAEKIDVRPGSLLAIPKGTAHAFVPTEMPLTAIQLYVPPGPEQRFKKLAAPK